MMLLLAACGGEDKDGEAWLDPAASGTSTMPDAVTPPDTDAGMTMVVTINDGHIAAAEASIPVGPAVLTVMNAGAELHDLHVEGPGVNRALDEPIDANESGTMAVTFQEGTYTMYCPILDHRQKGETLTMTIPSPPSPTS